MTRRVAPIRGRARPLVVVALLVLSALVSAAVPGATAAAAVVASPGDSSGQPETWWWSRWSKRRPLGDGDGPTTPSWFSRRRRRNMRFPSEHNHVRRVANGSQLHELTVALARASADPKRAGPAPSFWGGPRPLPRAVAVLFVDSGPHSLALRQLYESCLPAFFPADAVGFAVASHAEIAESAAARGLMVVAPRPKKKRQENEEHDEEEEEAWRREARRRSAEVASAVAARPLATVIKALPAVHVFGAGVGKGPGWQHERGGGGGGEKQRRQREQRRKQQSSSSAAPPPPVVLRRARYAGRHHLAPLVAWVADATGERPLISPDDAARLHCGFEGGAAEALRVGGGRVCPKADEAAAAAAAARSGIGSSNWRCDFWDGEATAAEMRRAWASSRLLWASAAYVAGRGAAWAWEQWGRSWRRRRRAVALSSVAAAAATATAALRRQQQLQEEHEHAD